LGTGLTAVTDIYDNIYNEDIGEWVFTPQTITGTLTENNVGIFDCDGDGKKDSVVDMIKYGLIVH